MTMDCKTLHMLFASSATKVAEDIFLFVINQVGDAALCIRHGCEAERDH